MDTTCFPLWCESTNLDLERGDHADAVLTGAPAGGSPAATDADNTAHVASGLLYSIAFTLKVGAKGVLVMTCVEGRNGLRCELRHKGEPRARRENRNFRGEGCN